MLKLIHNIFVCSLVLQLLQYGNGFKISVIHFNDFHARFEETNLNGGQCKTADCIGGLARLYYEINEIKTEIPDSIVLNAGDNFQGTLYYNLFKWNITQYFLNQIPHDAIVLGNHEFDDGIDGVVPFIKSLNAPVVVSNMDDSLEPSIQNLYKKSTIIKRNGKKIGIVGVIVSTADEISNTGKLKFFPEAESAIREAERLVEEEGVFTNIILSHSGYDIEQEIAKQVTLKSRIGLIVGGHSHSFLYTGEPVPGPDIVRGPYPTIIKNQDGQKVLVVQASAYCKYLGNLTVEYDDSALVVDWAGKPIYLDDATPQDVDILNELTPYKDAVDAQGNKVLGQTLVFLEQSTCYTQECLLGNVVTDAMVYEYTHKNLNNSWAYASLAIMHAGGLRTAINVGDITYNDLATAQPFGTTFDIGEIEGKYIKETFEHCAQNRYNYGRVSVDITLLQVSGFKIVFNLTNPEGSRVQSIKVRCNECLVPTYEDLDLNKIYRLVVPSFLESGGDGFISIRDHLKNVVIGRTDIEVISDYIEARTPIFEEISGRIEIISPKDIEVKYLFG